MAIRGNKQGKRATAIGLDLGSTHMKAAVVARDGERVKLLEYAAAPFTTPAGKAGAEQEFGNELHQFLNRLKVPERHIVAAITCSSAVVCEAELPRIPLEEVRNVLKLNSARYLRRDFSNYLFDTAELKDPQADPKGKKSQTMKLLVAGALRDEVLWYRDALVAAKIKPEAIELAAVSVINAFQVSHREVCEKDVVLLIDVGARSTTINFLRAGQPRLTRIMHFGGVQISEYLSQVLSMDPAAAEEEKMRMSETVQPLVKTALLPLAREIRASVDFFERQQECHVTRAYSCGGSACSEALLGFLGEEVGMPIAQWNPLEGYDLSQLNGEGPVLTGIAPSLAVALGAAVARV
jgi:type IV pilus assembly protein PilM